MGADSSPVHGRQTPRPDPATFPGMTAPVALVTGGTAGIGRALALALGQAGWAVGVGSRREAAVRATCAELEAAGAQAAGRAADVAVPDDVTALVDHVERSLGPVDLLVNNAGIARLRPIEQLTLDDWDATMATNVRSLFLCCRAVLPGMRARRRGTIVNVASLAGRNGFTGGTAYTASKHAVLGFSRSLMLETRGDGIRVLAVCPGSVDTALLRDQEMLHPDFARILRAEDVAQAILDAVRLPPRALVSELDIRPANP